MCLISQSKYSNISSVVLGCPKRVSNIDCWHKQRPVLFMDIKWTCEGVKRTLIKHLQANHWAGLTGWILSLSPPLRFQTAMNCRLKHSKFKAVRYLAVMQIQTIGYLQSSCRSNAEERYIKICFFLLLMHWRSASYKPPWFIDTLHYQTTTSLCLHVSFAHNSGETKALMANRAAAPQRLIGWQTHILTL